MFTERRVENADGTMDLKNLPPDLQKRIKARDRSGQIISLKDARERTEELLREVNA